jgi:hypothetical protein
MRAASVPKGMKTSSEASRTPSRTRPHHVIKNPNGRMLMPTTIILTGARADERIR